MPDITTITTVLTSLKTATDLAKLINDSGTSLEQAEIKLKLAELISALADAKMEIAAIQEILLEKDKEITKLKEEDALSEKIIWERPHYFVELDNGERDGPFCQKCYDSNKKLIRVQGGGNDYWKCEECESNFKGPGYKLPMARTARTKRGAW